MKKKLVWWILLVLLGWFGYKYWNNIKEIPEILSQGIWQFVLLAAIIQFLFFVAHAALYQDIFSLLGIQRKIREILPVLPASIFINSIAPTFGLGGIVLFADEAKKRDEPPSRVTVSFLLVQMIDYATFAVILGISLLYLSVSHNLKNYEIVATSVLLFIILILVSLLLLAIWQQTYLVKILTWGENLLNTVTSSFRKSPLLPGDWGKRHAEDFIEASNLIRHNPKRMIASIGFGFLKHLLNISSVFSLFLAFRQSVDLGTLISGFSIGILFGIVSVTPQGIGAVEGIMTVVYTTLGIPLAIATIIAISFRGLAYWIPLLVGIIAFKKLHHEDPGEINQ